MVLRTFALAPVLALLLTAAGPVAGAAEKPPAAAGFEPGAPASEAPAELAQFGRFAGIWDVQMKIIGDDGSWPDEAFAAEWRFRYILDGWAIQDEWFAPPPGKPAGEGTPQRGTGLRIYKPADGAWDVAWISNTQPQVTTFEARAEGDDRIVMTGLHPSGRPSRTTFRDITADSFDWTLELQGLGDDPDAWTEVARIHAERR